MRHVHSVRFEPLESRALLSGAHAGARVTHPAQATPLAIVGTLAVDDRDSATTTNPDGTMTTTVPVSGALGALGKVHGIWIENMDAYGDISGPDVLRLRDPKGSIVVTFNDQAPGPAHKYGRGTISHQHAQRLYAGTGAYVGDSESGTIQVVSNPAMTVVKSLVLDSKST